MLSNLIWAIVVILVLMWLLGLVAFHAGTLIYLLLLLALIGVVYNLFVGHRSGGGPL